MALMAVGAVAVMGMQKTSIQGNLDARKGDVANSIARGWIDRFQRDAMAWRVSASPVPATSLTNTTFLQSAAATNGTWILANGAQSSSGIPTSANLISGVVSPCYDILGRQVGVDAPIGEIEFCVYARALPLTAAKDLLRLDVRVVWSRGIIPLTSGTVNAPTAVMNLGTTDPLDPTVYDAVYATTAIQESSP